MVVGQFKRETHLVVIGGGPGGCAAALRAAELGVETVLVDAPPAPGRGVSLAALRRARDAIRTAERAAEVGVTFAKPKLDPAKLQGRSSERRWERLEAQCQERGVELIHGTAHFEDDRQVFVHNEVNARLRFKRAIIASGSMMRPPPADWPKSPRVTIWLPPADLPATLLVIGGGAIALELAGACATLGSCVSLVTEDERLLSETDEDLVEPVRRRCHELLEAVRVATAVTKVREVAGGIEADFNRGEGGPKRGTFDHVLVACGQQPNTGGLDLAKAKVELGADGAIPVDDQLRTSNPRIFAVGDVTGRPFLTNRAARQGYVAAEVIAGRDTVFDPRATPCAVWTDPPLAWCGLTEAAAQAAGIPYKVCKSHRSAGEPASLAPTESLIKLILDPDSQLVLGMGIVGPAAAEMIGEGALAIEMGTVADDLASTIHAHPTMSELLAEAAQQMRD
jgi:dihydrolipoamide dehydrogenase